MAFINEDMTNERENKGRAIAQIEGNIRRVSESIYRVKSQNGNGEYRLIFSESGWICNCPDSKFRGLKCKHSWAVEVSQKLRERVEQAIVIQPMSTTRCPFCASERIIKKGLRKNKCYNIERFLCRTCGKKFSFNQGFQGLKASPQIVTSAMQLYFSGTSFRSVQNFLKLQGVNVSHVTVYNWITKYVSLMEKYLEEIKPKVGDTWRADELYLKIKGDMKYLFAVMDDETRYWIAQEVADSKYTHDARSLFEQAKNVTGMERPRKLVTDGLPAYHDAFLKEFRTLRQDKESMHVSHIHLAGDMHNNRMERLNNEIRDREKTMRSLKSVDSPVLKGYQIFHNFIRPHMALDGKTPAEACGIKVEGKDKFKTLIENALAPRVNTKN